jgi:S1-C subfamily serine protease
MAIRYLKYLISILLTVALLASCCSPVIGKKQVKNSTRANDLFKVESFVMIRVLHLLLYLDCSENNQCKDTVTSSIEGAGSGFIVGSRGNKSYIITAAHVCSSFNHIAISQLLNLSTADHFIVRSGTGIAAEAKIIAEDRDLDICLLEADKIIGPSLKIAERPPLLHEKIYNMSNIASLAIKNAVPVFDGYYIGNSKRTMIFTITSYPGSSGSPVMNSKNEVYTIITSASTAIQNYGLGPKHKDFVNFIQKNLQN